MDGLRSETAPDPADGPPARGWARSLLRPAPSGSLVMPSIQSAPRAVPAMWAHNKREPRAPP